MQNYRTVKGLLLQLGTPLQGGVSTHKANYLHSSAPFQASRKQG